VMWSFLFVPLVTSIYMCHEEMHTINCGYRDVGTNVLFLFCLPGSDLSADTPNIRPKKGLEMVESLGVLSSTGAGQRKFTSATVTEDTEVQCLLEDHYPPH
jgi:hypothetical protein